MSILAILTDKKIMIYFLDCGNALQLKSSLHTQLQLAAANLKTGKNTMQKLCRTLRIISENYINLSTKPGLLCSLVKIDVYLKRYVHCIPIGMEKSVPYHELAVHSKITDLYLTIVNVQKIINIKISKIGILRLQTLS